MNGELFDREFLVDNRKEILIVDDVPANIRILANVLRYKYKLVVATSGKQTLEIVDRNTVDLILLDIEMPEMDGLEVCKKIKINPERCGIPIIFISATIDEKKRAKTFELGAADCLPKPPDKVTLLKRVREVLYQV